METGDVKEVSGHKLEWGDGGGGGGGGGDGHLAVEWTKVDGVCSSRTKSSFFLCLSEFGFATEQHTQNQPGNIH